MANDPLPAPPDDVRAALHEVINELSDAAALVVWKLLSVWLDREE